MTSFIKSLLIESSRSLIVAIIAISVSVYIGGKIEGLTTLFRTLNVTLERVEALVEAGPEGIRDVATALSEGAEEAGAGVGSGTASAITRAKEALRGWRAGDEADTYVPPDCIVESLQDGEGTCP